MLRTVCESRLSLLHQPGCQQLGYRRGDGQPGRGLDEPVLAGAVAGAGAAALGVTLASAGCSSTSTAPAAASTVLGPTSAVPVGGGKIYAAANVVVTQPTPGTYTGLSSTCTHQGCQVSQIVAKSILCPCHGSAYALDGTVTRGPAQKPLPAQAITVTGDKITIA